MQVKLFKLTPKLNMHTFIYHSSTVKATAQEYIRAVGL